MATKIIDRIMASPSLPSVPSVALRVLELTRQENVSVNDIADTIRNDPALTAKLLQTANSPLFGLAHKVGALEQATVILGLRTVKVMTLSFSLVDAMRESQTGGFDYQRYWRRSLTTAVASRLLAQHCSNVRTDECFVGGLLTDLGMLAAWQCVPEVYGVVIEQVTGTPQPIQKVESTVLGMTHAQISTALLRKWSLPGMLCDAVSAHHGDGMDALDDRTRMLASVMFAGASVGELFCGDVDVRKLEVVKQRCVELVGIAADNLDQVFDELQADVCDMASLFQLEIGEPISHETLRTQAMTQIANISISAEMDRAKAASQAEQVQQKLEEVSQKATTDGLTQIHNRQAFDDELNAMLARAQESGSSLGLIMLDLDHFKKLNDTYGHQAGDEALRRVGQCLKDHCREPAVPARYGGEEFAILLADTTARALQTLADYVRQEIEKIRFDHDQHPIQFTASLGAAHVDLELEEDTTAEDIIERADECLYDAKHHGRNRVEITF
ncbi:MAG: GGDEF domain-containing protein [bacterium]|nr:GGDEF domain-containing protein [bacterium]